MANRILRPLEYGDILDELFDLYKSKFLLFAGIAAVVYFPIDMIACAMIGAEDANIAMMILSYPFSLFVAGATTYAVAQSYLGYEVNIGSAYKAVFRIGLPFFLTMLAVVVILTIGLVLCVVPGVLLWIVLAFTPQILVIENKYYSEAFKRSRELAAGQWGRIFVVSIIVYIIYSVISSILTTVFMVPAIILGAAMPGEELPYIASVLIGFGAALSSALTIPIVIIPFVLLYYDLRVRKEGFDIEMLANSMGVSAPQQPVSPYAASSQSFAPGSYNPEADDKNEDPYKGG